MDIILDFASRFGSQLQSPALAFLIGGILIAASGSKLRIPGQVYQFVVFMLLMKIGLKAGIEIREANLADMILPIIISTVTGVLVVVVGSAVFKYLPGVKREDGIATAGLFGAVSASTLAAAILMLEEQDITYEAWVPALYPFMDIPALILAIVLANVHLKKQGAAAEGKWSVKGIIKDSLRSSAISAMLLGIALGILSKPESVFEGFYDPLFRGFLSILMLVLGIEAYSRLHELIKVAHWYALYALLAPILQGLFAFGLGTLAHHWMGFSPGGVILLSVIAASNSDISGPPTLRAGIPSANPSTYIGASTSVGTPVAVAICIPLFLALGQAVFEL